MSDAERKMDVDDVLSSIRRLVSEEARGAKDSDTETTEVKEAEAVATAVEETVVEKPAEKVEFVSHAAQKHADKLILTPSLRVSDAERPIADTTEIEKRIADIESLVLNESERQSTTEDALEAEATDDEKRAVQVVREPVIEDEPEPNKADDLSQAVANALEAETTPEPETLSATPFIPAPPDESDFPTQTPFEADLEESGEMANEEAEIGVEIVEEQPAVVREEPVLVTPKPEVFTPEPEAELEAGQSIADDHDIEDDLDVEPMAPVGEMDLLAESEDDFLDEETLRELVSEMVRSELQGELGDRITRNVRKLVRREIHRALASRDFE